MTKAKIDSYASVWDAITDTPEEAANLRLRSELVNKITALLQKNGWTQFEAAKHCSVTLLARCTGQHRRAPRPAGAC